MVGASFSFGNRLVTFSTLDVDANNSFHQGQGDESVKKVRHVNVRFVSGAVDFIVRSRALEEACAQEQFQPFCSEKIRTLTDEKEKEIWMALQAIIGSNAREQLLGQLGFDNDDLSVRVEKLVATKNLEPAHSAPPKVATVVSASQNKLQIDSNSESSAVAEPSALAVSEIINDVLRAVEADQSAVVSDVVALSSPLHQSSCDPCNDVIHRALVMGNFESAVDICVKLDRFDDALFLAVCGGPDLLAQTQKIFIEKRQSSYSYIQLASGILSHDLMQVISREL